MFYERFIYIFWIDSSEFLSRDAGSDLPLLGWGITTLCKDSDEKLVKLTFACS